MGRSSVPAIALGVVQIFLLAVEISAFVQRTMPVTSSSSRLNVVGQQAESFGPASVIRKFKSSLPQIDWLAEGTPPADNKVNMPDHVKAVLSRPDAPELRRLSRRS